MTLSTIQGAVETDPLVVAIVSVIATLIVGIVTAVLTRKGEHAKWLREQRYEAYVAFMIDMRTWTAMLETELSLLNVAKVKARADAHTEHAFAAFEAVSLLGPRRVNAAGQRWVRAADSFAKNKSTLGRTQLSEARWQFLIVAGEILNSKNVAAEPIEGSGAAPRRAVAPASR